MALTLQPDSFLRAATRPAARFSLLDLSSTGFVSCAVISGALWLSLAATSETAQAHAKPSGAAPKKALVTSPSVKPATQTVSRPKGTQAQTPKVVVASTTEATSKVARARVSPMQTMRAISVSSRGTSTSQTTTEEEPVEAAPQVNQPVPAQVAQQPAPKVAPAGTAQDALSQDMPSQDDPPRFQLAPAPPVAAPATQSRTEKFAQARASNAQAPAAATIDLQQDGTPLTGTVDFSAARPAAPANATTAASPEPPDATGTPATGGSTATAPATVTPPTTPASATATSRLYAPSISYEGGTIIAAGTPEDPVRLESADARIIAQNVRLDTVGKTVSAQGQVRVERQVKVERYSAFRTQGNGDYKKATETITETFIGEDFEYNYETRQGKLGRTSVRLASFNVSAESLVINGQKYIARNVVVRPGGLSEEELQIYGTPPFNLRLREFTVDASKPEREGSADVSDTGKEDGASVKLGARTSGRGGALYFKNTKLIPVPSAVLSRRLGPREEAAYQLTPRVYYNSSDGLLVTARLHFPFSKTNPERLALRTDVGLSTKVGFRGGVELESETAFGDISVGARINDLVTTQLTNRIELDRLPEIQYRPPALRLLNLPGGRTAGLRFGFIAGDYRERFSDGRNNTESSRLQGQVRFTTRLGRQDGPYVDLFARAAKYSDHDEELRTAGYEVGYVGQLFDRVGGRFSYSATSISGSTPFLFDEVEIRKELRATFDILVTPRYIVPIDLRYDIERSDIRDASFGILRNYKTFAYGITFQTARKELKLEIRQGF